MEYIFLTIYIYIFPTCKYFFFSSWYELVYHLSYVSYSDGITNFISYLLLFTILFYENVILPTLNKELLLLLLLLLNYILAAENIS